VQVRAGVCPRQDPGEDSEIVLAAVRNDKPAECRQGNEGE